MINLGATLTSVKFIWAPVQPPQALLRARADEAAHL
jgi:hypothetical protein